MSLKFSRIVSMTLVTPMMFISQASLAQIMSRPPRMEMNVPTAPAPDLSRIQDQINQLIAENKQLRADLTIFQKCYDNHQHWLVGFDQVATISTPKSTGKAKGFGDLSPPCYIPEYNFNVPH